jgi:hypothetical protein
MVLTIVALEKQGMMISNATGSLRRKVDRQVQFFVSEA